MIGAFYAIVLAIGPNPSTNALSKNDYSAGDWALQPYLGVNYEGELNGRPGATLSSGGEDLYFRDASEGGRARWEAGIQGTTQGLSAFAKVEGVTGSGSSGVAGRAGVAIRW